MDLNKHLEFFNPAKIKDLELHIVGVGAIGGYIAIQLAKLGITTLHIWDFDTVDEHNITNQVYDYNDLNKQKTDALAIKLIANNPELKIYTHKKYTNQNLKGIVFLAVDSIKTRRAIAESNLYNVFVDLMIDSRLGLERGQVLAVDWKSTEAKENFIKMCDFTDEESDAKTTACGTMLSVSPSVLITVAYAISQLINFVNTGKVQKLISFDAFSYKTRAV